MAQQAFWSVACGEGEPDLWVCMSCLSEAYRRKVPMPDCPTCHRVSTYEAFTLESIKEWGSQELIDKAGRATVEPPPLPPRAEEPPAELTE
jgi:hypothetical protein